jgi:hypothetical protein
MRTVPPQASRRALDPLTPEGCNVVTPTDLVTATPASKNTPALQTIPTVTVQTAVPHLGMEFHPDQHQAYQEEQQV